MRSAARDDTQKKVERFAGKVVSDLAAAMAGVTTNLAYIEAAARVFRSRTERIHLLSVQWFSPRGWGKSVWPLVRSI